MAQCYGYKSVVLRRRDAVTSLGVFKCSLKSEDTGFARSGREVTRARLVLLTLAPAG